MADLRVNTVEEAFWSALKSDDGGHVDREIGTVDVRDIDGTKAAQAILAALDESTQPVTDLRKARALTLRTAANEVPVANDGLIGGKDLRNWLRHRANRIERGEIP